MPGICASLYISDGWGYEISVILVPLLKRDFNVRYVWSTIIKRATVDVMKAGVISYIKR